MTEEERLGKTEPRASGDDEPADDGRTSATEGDLASALALCDEGVPLVLMEGVVTTDAGHMILTQYVDIGTEKRVSRAPVLVKAIESEYGLEHAAYIQLSAPWRFRDYGETLIRDDQEGYARRETTTETTPRSPADSNREQERALRLLGEEGVTISGTGARSVATNTESLTFGRSAWIYCTSIKPPSNERDAWLSSLPTDYDHGSMIRQPCKFALALGEMFADQHGPKGKRADFKHAGGIRSLHDSQMVLHGPVWYTDDVLGFLESRQSDPLYNIYALFLKHTDYQDQREYRFVVHCETPVNDDTLHLRIGGNMRGALAPPRNVRPVAFDSLETPEAESSSKPVTTRTLHSRTMTRTRRESEKRTWKTHIGGEIVEDGVATRERVIAVTTEVPTDVSPETAQGAKATGPGIGTVSESAQSEHKLRGEVVDAQTSSRTTVVSLDEATNAGEVFTLEDRDEAAARLEVAARPFEAFADLRNPPVETLKTLGQLASTLERDVEVQAMSACWNAIWAICNLQECYGDVIQSVDIEDREFVAVTLKESARAGANGKILVGPRGTFAYVLTLGEKRRSGFGGTEARLVFFPDDATRATFAEFGWQLGSNSDDTT